MMNGHNSLAAEIIPTFISVELTFFFLIYFFDFYIIFIDKRFSGTSLISEKSMMCQILRGVNALSALTNKEGKKW